jgi:hypothetical protein
MCVDHALIKTGQVVDADRRLKEVMRLKKTSLTSNTG